MRTPLPKSLAGSMPVPDGEALVHTRACTDMLRAEIAGAGGWLSFEQFMQLALYTPGLGYYAASARKFGAWLRCAARPSRRASNALANACAFRGSSFPIA